MTTPATVRRMFLIVCSSLGRIRSDYFSRNHRSSCATIRNKLHGKLKPLSQDSSPQVPQAKDPLFPRKQIRQIAHKMRVVGAAARLQGMIYAGTKQEIETKAQGVHPQVALKCEAVSDNLDE